MMQASSLFKYNCSCGNTDFLRLDVNEARCPHCDANYPLSPTGVIIFHQQKTEQNDYFDGIYSAGHGHAKDEFQENNAGPFENCVQRAESHLQLCGIDTTRSLKGLSFLDVACGAGWLTAGLMQNKNISNSKFHAFDISSNGLDLLARYVKGLKSADGLELSVQHAEKMRFGDASFDVIIGSSFLHHLDDYEIFLTDCRRILKPDGVALFGEPFAIGYGLGAAALLLAQRDLGTHHQEIEEFYADIVNRVTRPREGLRNLVDKHLFFQSIFLPMAQKIGFRSVEFGSGAPREYYRDSFITKELLLDRGISMRAWQNGQMPSTACFMTFLALIPLFIRSWVSDT